MELVLDIAKVLALVSVAALCIYLVVLLVRVKATVATLETVVKDVSQRATPVIMNLQEITTKVNTVMETVEDQVDVVRTSVASLKSMTDNIVSFERMVQDRVEGPVLRVASYAKAVSRGVGTFVDRMRQNR